MVILSNPAGLTVPDSLRSAAALASELARAFDLGASIGPMTTALATGLGALADREHEQRVRAGRARAEKVEQERRRWRSGALQHAKRLRRADPQISQGRLADALLAALPERAPVREVVVRHIRAWEDAGDLPKTRRSGRQRNGVTSNSKV